MKLKIIYVIFITDHKVCSRLSKDVNCFAAQAKVSSMAVKL